MPKPKQITALTILYGNGMFRSLLKVSTLDLKNGTKKYYLEVPSAIGNKTVYNGVINAIDTLKNKSYIESILLNGDKVEFFLTVGSSSSLKASKHFVFMILLKIQEEIQGETSAWESKNIAAAPSPAPQMVYAFTEQDIEDLDENDVITYERQNGTIATLKIIKIEIQGQEFKVIIKYKESSNSQPKEEIRNLTRDNLETLMKNQVIRDFKKAPTKTSAPNQPSTSSVSSMSDIRVETIINQTEWSQGLKDSMLEDFKSSGYFMFADLVRDDVRKTAQRIEEKIDGFASGKNTYLQANLLATRLFLYAQDNGIPQFPWSAPTSPSQPNVSEPINAIIIKGTYAGEMIKVIKPSNNGLEEKDFDYECISNGMTAFSPRNNFMVVGDIIQITFSSGSSNNAKILVIENDTTIKIDSANFGVENWNIGGFDWDNSSIKILEYYNLHELYKTKEMAKNILPPKDAAPKKPLSDDEKEIEKIKKDVGNLLFIKSTFSGVEFEEIMKVSQKIVEKQKQINDLNVIVVDKKLKGNQIFDDLFEQSFAPIKNNYDVYVSSETENTEFFAPNGDKSELKNSLNSIIRTPLFKEWFGDWQLSYQYRDIENSGFECSKVVNKNFEPLVVWHGTGTQFSYFRFDNFPAAYFAVNQKYSEWFAYAQSGGEEGYTMPFFLNLRNPLDLTKFGTNAVAPKDFLDYMYVMTGMTPQELELNPIYLDPRTPSDLIWVYLRNNAKFLKKLADSHLFDGIHFYETNPNIQPNEAAYVTEAYITFSPDSCKIADPDRGDLVLAAMKSFLLEKGGKI